MISNNIENQYSNTKAQVTIFIIIAVMIVVGMLVYFYFRSDLFKTEIPAEFSPVYDYYLSCIDDETRNAVFLLGTSGGYIELPDFSPGSEYMPFSSQLNFLGDGIPYWHYISGNNVVKEEVPSKEKMQDQMNNFLKKRVSNCDIFRFEEQGFKIIIGDIEEVETKINNDNIEVNIKQDISIAYGDNSWSGSSHSREVKSSFGRFYELALKIYQNQEDTEFLENYGVDILRLYAPVDGTEVSCNPKIWKVDDVREGLMSALEVNTPMIKLEGDYYGLKKDENKYFVRDIGEKVDANVNFVYLRNWPMKMEVWPSEGGLMRADPVGLQEGLGALGFCYVPYHFVYDFAYPVLIQIYYDNEIFQFPVVVNIDKNKPVKSGIGEKISDLAPELCKHKLSDVSVYSYNTNLEPIEALIQYKCFDSSCDIGKTLMNGNEAVLKSKFPQCVNGYLIASAEGYKTKKQIFSSVNEKSVQIVLDKKYKLSLEVTGINKDGYAIITFTKDNEPVTVSYPEQKEIELTEGQYEIKAYAYSGSAISLNGKSQQCVDVPSSGISGILGISEKKCFDIDTSSISGPAISGGGKQSQYITESELETSRKIFVEVENFGIPSTVEELQSNYNKIETGRLDINLE